MVAPIVPVRIGSLTVSAQAVIVASASAVLAFVVMFALPHAPGVRLTMFSLVLLTGFLAAYNVNCSVMGPCHLWAWALAVVYAINLLTAAAMHVSCAFNKKTCRMHVRVR